MKPMDRHIFGTIIKYELKKLITNKVTIIALIVSTCLLAGVSLIEYTIISPEDRYIEKREGEMEGRALDESLIDDVVDTAIPYGSLTAIPGENKYYHVGTYMNRALGTYMSIEGISGEYELSELNEQQFYQTREEIFEKGTIAIAKLISGGLFSAAVGGILFIAVNIPHVIFNGLSGWDTACQLIVPFTSYTYTSGKMVLVCFGIYMLASLLVGAFVMLLSSVLKNMVATAGVVCAAVCVDLFFTIPPKFRILSQVRYLTPVQVLINSSMTDPRLVQVGGHYLTAFHIASIIYVALTCGFSILIFMTYKYGRR